MKPLSKIMADLEALKQAKHDDIELSNEDMPDETPQGLYIEYSFEEWIPDSDMTKFTCKRLPIPFDPKFFESLVLICTDAVKKKNPAMTLDNYLRCWTQDMAEQIGEAGATFSQLIAEVKKRLSNGESSPTTSATDITSSSSYKPTKTASQTSLL